MPLTIPLSPEQTREVSDGYHTFEELYDHRCLLFFCLASVQNSFQPIWKPHYPGWPVLFIETPAGQICYHFPEKYLPIVETFAVRSDSYEWDGHTSKDVLERLERWAKAPGVFGE